MGNRKRAKSNQTHFVATFQSVGNCVESCFNYGGCIGFRNIRTRCDFRNQVIFIHVRSLSWLLILLIRKVYEYVPCSIHFPRKCKGFTQTTHNETNSLGGNAVLAGLEVVKDIHSKPNSYGRSKSLTNRRHITKKSGQILTTLYFLYYFQCISAQLSQPRLLSWQDSPLLLQDSCLHPTRLPQASSPEHV